VYLHKSVFQSHGYLSSANCHVDSRWVLKVSGFGLHAFTKYSHTEVSTSRDLFSPVIIKMLNYQSLVNDKRVEEMDRRGREKRKSWSNKGV